MKALKSNLAKHRFFPAENQGALLPKYLGLIGESAVEELKGYRPRFEGRKIIHVNSTFCGGGVAEILQREVRLANELGIVTEWYRVRGNEDFFETTKGFHNALQGKRNGDPAALIGRYLDFYNNGGGELNRGLIDYLRGLAPEDVVIIHDPQPLHLIHYMDRMNALKLWRTHIDTSSPDPQTMSYVAAQAEKYDGIISTMEEYMAPHLKSFRALHTLAPSIDPFSDKNCDMDPREVRRRVSRHGIRAERPLLLQVSRLDPWKDPVGVIDVYEKIRGYGRECQLALVYNSADDDPEGADMERLVRARRDRSPHRDDIHLVNGDDPRDVNAFQRHAAVVIQKSIREGFGLTVTEALFKEALVVANEVGGIRLQVRDGSTGFLVKPHRSADGVPPARLADQERHVDLFALKCISALEARGEGIGKQARKTVVDKFLTTSKLRNLLDIILDSDSDRRAG